MGESAGEGDGGGGSHTTAARSRSNSTKSSKEKEKADKYRKTWPSLGTYPGVDAGVTGASKLIQTSLGSNPAKTTVNECYDPNFLLRFNATIWLGLFGPWQNSN